MDSSFSTQCILIVCAVLLVVRISIELLRWTRPGIKSILLNLLLLTIIGTFLLQTLVEVSPKTMLTREPIVSNLGLELVAAFFQATVLSGICELLVRGCMATIGFRS